MKILFIDYKIKVSCEKKFLNIISVLFLCIFIVIRRDSLECIQRDSVALKKPNRIIFQIQKLSLRYFGKYLRDTFAQC